MEKFAMPCSKSVNLSDVIVCGVFVGVAVSIGVAIVGSMSLFSIFYVNEL